jgi:ubiquitin-conjugating enzyme E2 M
MTEPNLKLLFNEFVNINQDRKGVYEDQALIEFPNGEENPLNLKVVVTPKYGFFRNGRIEFSVILPKDYPRSKPTVKCLTKVFHPNIK